MVKIIIFIAGNVSVNQSSVIHSSLGYISLKNNEKDNTAMSEKQFIFFLRFRFCIFIKLIVNYFIQIIKVPQDIFRLSIQNCKQIQLRTNWTLMVFVSLLNHLLIMRHRLPKHSFTQVCTELCKFSWVIVVRDCLCHCPCTFLWTIASKDS